MSQQSAARPKIARTRGADYVPPSTLLKRTRGRPSHLNEDVIELAKEMSGNGATIDEIAAALHVDRGTIYNWMNRSPEFFNAVKVGGKAADDRVVQTLYHRAVTGESDTAAIFWLKNRRPNEWRDKRDVELGGAIDVTDNSARSMALAALALVRAAVEDTLEPVTIEHDDDR